MGMLVIIASLMIVIIGGAYWKYTVWLIQQEDLEFLNYQKELLKGDDDDAN
jgi:hypothetical protein